MSGDRRGIILAGERDQIISSNQNYLQAIITSYDKPMIYYPLSILMLSGIKEILIIVSPSQEELFKVIRRWKSVGD